MNGRKLEFSDEDAKIYWILSYMQTGSAKTWCNYVVTLMFKEQHSFMISEELLKEIDHKFSLNAGLRRRLMELWPMPVTIEQ